MDAILADYVLSKSGEMSFLPPDGQLLSARSILQSYSQGVLTYSQAVEAYRNIRPTNYPIDLLHDILAVAEQPLPAPTFAAPRFPPSRHAKMRCWTSVEDRRLLAGILRFGTDDWQKISGFVGSGRSKSQCHQRWTRGLDPRIVRETWTPQQDELLLMLVALYGEKCWTQVSWIVGNRSDVQCRYRFNLLRRDISFGMRMCAAAARVIANPGIIGRPLLPISSRRKRRPKTLIEIAPAKDRSDGEWPIEDDSQIEGLFDDEGRTIRSLEDSVSDFDDSE
jgi:hypothetical protein